VTVATELPVTGSDASDGIPAQNGAKLAVTQANSNHLLGGCVVALISEDDASAPGVGAANMTVLAGNNAVVGVLGPLSWNACAAEQPLANRVDLAQISPSCTVSGLTIPGSTPTIDTAALRPTGRITFFRVCTTDIKQGAADAQVAVALGGLKAFVFDDQEPYGQGLARSFATDFQADGGTEVGNSSLPGSTTDFSAGLATARRDGADLVFFGGTSRGGGGMLRSQMAPAGLGTDVIFEGGGGIQNADFIVDAGGSGAGAYSTIAAPDVVSLSSANSFLTAYQAVYNTAPAGYAANAYDAMNIILMAVKRAIIANGGTLPGNVQTFRESVRSNIASIQYDGAIGHTAFDNDGDSTNPLLTLWQVQDGKWTFIKTVNVPAQ